MIKRNYVQFIYGMQALKLGLNLEKRIIVAENYTKDCALN